MRRGLILISLLSILLSQSTLAQNQYTVPDRLTVAGMDLHIKSSAKRDIQKSVDQLVRSKTYHDRLVKLCDRHFPLIEQIFDQENVPTDFKYLIIQESAFRAEAVSSSNAVGYWQFKEPAAKEMGLRVDRQIDERKNLVSASRGAARYLAYNNATLDNWMYALMAYNTGLGGAKKHIQDKYLGKRKMDIDGHTHWYVLKFLAHVVAFRHDVGNHKPDFILDAVYETSGKSVKDWGDILNIGEDDIIAYNKWIRPAKDIPGDKNYPVIYPSQKDLLASADTPADKKVENKTDKKDDVLEINIDLSWGSKDNGWKKNNKPYSGEGVPLIFSVNKVKALKATEKDTKGTMANKGDISLKRFLRYNDMERYEQLVPGQTYYLSKKKRKAMVPYHTVQEGEDIWDIAQEYAVREKRIRKMNRMGKNESMVPGRILYLRKKRPKDEPVRYEKIVKERPKKVAKAVQTENKKEPVVETVQPQKTEDKPDKKPDREDAALASDENPVAEVEKDSAREKDPVQNKDLESAQKPEISQSEPKDEADSTNQEPTIPQQYTFHKVAQGEGLYGISKKYDVSIEEIRKANNLPDNNIDINQILKIPSQQNEKEAITTADHVVSPGETLYSIAKKHEVSVEKLKEWNELTSNSLSVGQKLIIRK